MISDQAMVGVMAGRIFLSLAERDWGGGGGGGDEVGEGEMYMEMVRDG